MGRQGPSRADWLLCIPCARSGNMTSVNSHAAIGCWVYFWPQYHVLMHKTLNAMQRKVSCYAECLAVLGQTRASLPERVQSPQASIELCPYTL